MEEPPVWLSVLEETDGKSCPGSELGWPWPPLLSEKLSELSPAGFWLSIFEGIESLSLSSPSCEELALWEEDELSLFEVLVPGEQADTKRVAKINVKAMAFFKGHTPCKYWLYFLL